MDSSMTHQELGSHGEQRGLNDLNRVDQAATEGQSEDGATARQVSDSQNRHESVATAMDTGSLTPKVEPMNMIETDNPNDTNDSDHHRLNLSETVKHAAHSARRKLYLHHRHQRDFNKQFSPDSIAKHLDPAGRHVGAGQQPHHDPEAQVGAAETFPPTVWRNLWIMVTTFPYWNMAFWSGWCYSIGSAFFIIDGAWSWVPLQWPQTEFDGESEYGVPLWFFFGAILYQVGGVMAYLEAVNDGCFAGAAMKKLIDGQAHLEKELLDTKLHTFFGHIVPHHHHDDHEELDKHQSLDFGASWNPSSSNETSESDYDKLKEQIARRGGVDRGLPKEGEVSEYLTWQWWPSWHSFRTYHIFELGYVACAIQLFGVTLYGVTAIVILPGILDSLAWWQEVAAYWVPQVVASCCFIIASVMFTLMGQEKWYKIKPNAVSWWIGIWALVGSVGFLLCAIFGFFSHNHTWGGYQSSLSSMWGSVFYMLSGLFQWYEAINVNVGPVLAFPNNRTPVVLRKRLA